MVDRFAVLRTGDFGAAFLAVTFVVVFAAVFFATGPFAVPFFAGIRLTEVFLAGGLMITAFFATGLFAELFLLAGFPRGFFDAFDTGASLAVVTSFDDLRVAFCRTTAPRLRPTTLSVPAAGKKLDSSPEDHRTVSMRP